MNSNKQFSFDFGEEETTLTGFIGFQDFQSLSKGEKKQAVHALGKEMHQYFVSIKGDREFRDDSGELITNLYSLIINEICTPHIGNICTRSGRYPLYQKYLILYFISKYMQDNRGHFASLFHHSAGSADSEKRVASLIKNKGLAGTQVSHGMIASVLFHIHQSFFTEKVWKLIPEGRNS